MSYQFGRSSCLCSFIAIPPCMLCCLYIPAMNVSSAFCISCQSVKCVDAYTCLRDHLDEFSITVLYSVLHVLPRSMSGSSDTITSTALSVPKANYATELMTFGGKYELDDHVVILRPSTVVVESASMVRHRTRGVSLLRMAD